MKDFDLDFGEPVLKTNFVLEVNGYDLFEIVEDMYDFEGVDYFTVQRYFPEFEIDTNKQYIIIKDGESIDD